MTTDIDNEDRVRTAVATLANRAAGPDHQRLARIEQRLLARRRHRTSAAWWWIVLGCGLAGGAVAGYWGLYGNGNLAPAAGEEQAVPATGTKPAATDHPDDDSDESTHDSRDNGESPIIYLGQ